MNVVGYEGGGFESIEVLKLNPDASAAAPDAEVLHTGKHWQSLVVERHLCDIEEAAILIGLWNTLPEGEQARCHIPGYGFRIFRKGEAIFAAAICWRCNNASMGGSAATLEYRSFDADSAAAQQLLFLCERLTEPTIGG